MKRLYVNPAKTAEMYKVAVVKKCYVHEIAAVNLSKIYFLKNAKKTCKPNNRDWINRDWIIQFSLLEKSA